MFGDVSGVQCQAYSQLTSSFRHSFASTDAIKFALAVDSPWYQFCCHSNGVCDQLQG